MRARVVRARGGGDDVDAPQRSRGDSPAAAGGALEEEGKRQGSGTRVWVIIRGYLLALRAIQRNAGGLASSASSTSSSASSISAVSFSSDSYF